MNPYGLTPERVRTALEPFWSVGLDRVSPGALGMKLFHFPLLDTEVKPVIDVMPGLHWDAGGYIVRVLSSESGRQGSGTTAGELAASRKGEG